MEEFLRGLMSEDEKVVMRTLDLFADKYKQVFIFPEFDHDNFRQILWKAVFKQLTNKQIPNAHPKCLHAIRILSRDKTNLDEMLEEPWFGTLLFFAGLKITDEVVQQRNIFSNYEIIVESLKCLCNVIYNSNIAQTISAKNGTLEGLMKRLLSYHVSEIPFDVRHFDMRLLFLITACCSEVRYKLKEELHGVTYLTESLDSIMKEAEKSTPAQLTDQQVDLACELLKVLFNLTLGIKFSIQIEEEDEDEKTHYLKLLTVVHNLLLMQTKTKRKKYDLHKHTISLLTGLPTICLKELMIPSQDQEITKNIEYKGSNMIAVYMMLEFLKNKFETELTPRGQMELLPVVSVLIKCANSSSKMRKYIRQEILPPLRDVHRRPEEGTTLRNHLCRLLTSLVTQVRDYVAELLFILCKENVARMIKYTGYGNAAGLFAHRGLMGGRVSLDENKYSSDSEDSDTEEYLKFKHGINPIIGCYEAPYPDPTEGMSEEQKEMEAMRLVELMDELTRKGILQPCLISHEGRPEPIEDVMQLQEELPKQQIRRNSDSS